MQRLGPEDFVYQNLEARRLNQSFLSGPSAGDDPKLEHLQSLATQGA